jgi:hypothetical protein
MDTNHKAQEGKVLTSCTYSLRVQGILHLHIGVRSLPALRSKHNIFSFLDRCSCTITLGKFFEGALQKERIKYVAAAFLGSTQNFLTQALHFGLFLMLLKGVSHLIELNFTKGQCR